jgi:hypothetical protein
MKRHSISKRTRFSIFERDWFTCQYCGRTPTEHNVVLEIDHSISVKDWWENDIENLITSCFDCNRWKSKKSVVLWKFDNIKDLQDEEKFVKDRLEQIKYIKKIKEKIRKLNKKIEEDKYWFVNDILYRYSDELKRQMNVRIKTQHTKYNIDLDILQDWLEITLNKFSEYKEFYINDFVKYFYWVLRNLLNNQ